MSIRSGIKSVALMTVAWLLPVTATAQDRDNLWEITTKMEMPRMPMAMPAQTIQQCLGKNSKDEDYLPRRDNCRVLESQRTGNRVTFKMACSAPEAIDITGEMNLGGETYDGKMLMVARTAGQSMEMTNTFSGKRIGTCTAPRK
jgi:Protein of unknown function (DUF3617)